MRRKYQKEKTIYLMEHTLVCSGVVRRPHQQVELLHAWLNSQYLLHQHCTNTIELH
jgi:rhamnose utilization protein RhaD (predicted bifunctional aldolase and dehydrogenase)